MSYADLILESREHAGLSLRQLADRAGTSAAALCLYENGGRVPKVDTLQRVIEATGTRLVMVCDRGDPIDAFDNGRRLEDVLDLADALPQRHDPELAYPVLRDLTS